MMLGYWRGCVSVGEGLFQLEGCVFEIGGGLFQLEGVCFWIGGGVFQLERMFLK